MSAIILDGIKAGSTDVSLPVELRAAADSTAVTGKAYTDITGSYWRAGGTRTAITMAPLAAVDSAHSYGGFKEVDATNMPGVYRLDLPDAAVASGAAWVVITLKCSGCFTQSFMVPLTTDTPQSADGDVASIAGSSAAAAALAASAGAIIVDTIAAGHTETTTTLKGAGTASLDATDDHYNGRVIIFTSGALAGQAAEILDYDGASNVFTITERTEAPGDDDAFLIL